MSIGRDLVDPLSDQLGVVLGDRSRGQVAGERALDELGPLVVKCPIAARRRFIIFRGSSRKR
jgi:hypothetical protein